MAESLDEAVRCGRRAVAATAADHPDRANYQDNLGNALETRFAQSGDRVDLLEARAADATASRATTASISARITAAWGWGRVGMLAGDPIDALVGFELAAELLPQLAPCRLARTDREYGLGQLAGFAAQAAAAAVAAGRLGRAVELLEQTRGVLLAEALDARSDRTALRNQHPALAQRLDRMIEALNALDESVTDDPASRVADRRREAQQEWETVVAEIRRLPSFAGFLRSTRLNSLPNRPLRDPS